jgi:hypothetical protein
LKNNAFKVPGSDQISAEMIETGSEMECMNLLTLFGIRKNYVNSGKSLLWYQFTKRAIELPLIITAD